MAGVNVKMGVTGVSQFKQSMTQARNSVKTLDQALQLNEKQFKATGDAQEYTQKKAELLREKLEEQKKVVEQAEKALETMTRNGVEKTSSAFQSMQRELLKAKGDILDTSTQLSGIGDAAIDAQGSVQEMADTLNGINQEVSFKGLNDSVTGVKSNLDSINTQVSFKTVIDGIGSITSAMEAVAKRAWKLGEELVRNTLGAGSWADELVTTATQLQGIDPSMTPEKLQRMRKTANLIDTSVDAIMSSKQKLANAQKGKQIDDIFATFGIQNTRYGDYENLDDVFWATGEALMKINDETKRAQMGKQLFGNWTELIPLFQAGREEYEKTMEAQSVVSDESIEKLTKMDDQYQKMQNELETIRNEFFAQLAPAITSVMETLTGLMEKFNEYLKTDEGQAMMQALSDAVTALFEDLTKIDPEEALQGFIGLIDGLKSSFEWIKEHSHDLVTALEIIVGGWAALKLTGGALQLLNLVNGLKGLGDGSIKTPTLPGTEQGADRTGTAPKDAIKTGNPTADGAAGAAGGHAVAKTTIAGGLKGAATTALQMAAAETAVVAAAVAPAILQTLENQSEWREEQKSRINALNAVEEALGYKSENLKFVEEAAIELGPTPDAKTGDYKRDVTGLLYNMNPTDKRDALLMGLADRQGKQKAELYNAIQQYAKPTAGYDTWTALNKYWNNQDLDTFEVTELLENVNDALLKAEQAKANPDAAKEEAAKRAADIVAQAAEMAAAEVPKAADKYAGKRADQVLEEMRKEAQAVLEHLTGENPALEEGYEMMADALEEGGGATATLLKDWAERYRQAFDEMGDEPVIESIYENLSDGLWEELENALIKIGDGDYIDPVYAEELMKRVREELGDALVPELNDQNVNLTDGAHTMGENVSIGLANGIDDEADTAIQSAQNLANSVAAIIQSTLDMHSPSRLMARMGEFVSMGFAEGIESGIGRVMDAAGNMAAAASTPVRSAGSLGGNREIHVTLMLDSDRLTEVVVPLVDNSLGEEINLIRR